jgi:hypothetical protein
MNGKALCLICSESIVLKEYNITRHYHSKHKEKYKNCVGALRREKVVALQKVLQSQQNISRKQSNDSSSALQQLIVLLTCWLMEANHSLMGNS